MKEWVPVFGYEGLYEVSIYGEIRSINRTIKSDKFVGKGGRRSVSGGILKQAKTSNGYMSVSLSKDGRSKTMSVHRIVLESFVRTARKGEVCRHYPDKNKANNKLENLQWGSGSQNQKDRRLQGTYHLAGRKRSLCKCKEKEVRDIYSKENISQRKLAEIYNVSASTVNLIINKR